MRKFIPENQLNDFADRRAILKETRLRKGITINQITDATNMSRRQYSLKERGHYMFKDYEMLVISKMLEMPIDELFFKGVK